MLIRGNNLSPFGKENIKNRTDCGGSVINVVMCMGSEAQQRALHYLMYFKTELNEVVFLSVSHCQRNIT